MQYIFTGFVTKFHAIGRLTSFIFLIQCYEFVKCFFLFGKQFSQNDPSQDFPKSCPNGPEVRLHVRNIMKTLCYLALDKTRSQGKGLWHGYRRTSDGKKSYQLYAQR